MKSFSSAVALAVTLALGGLSGCNNEPVASQVQAQAQSESEKANALFDALFMEEVMASPMAQTQLGLKQDQDKWDEFSEAQYQRDLERRQGQLARLLEIDASQLDSATRLSFDLMKQDLENAIADHRWRYHSYPVNQMRGIQSRTAAFLINQHAIEDEADARAYISRLQGIEKRFDQAIEQLKVRADKGIIAPKFVFAYAISDSKNILAGAPFEAGPDSTLLADFKGKLASIEIDADTRAQLIKQAETALSNQVAAGYGKLISYLGELEQQADERDGVWKLPDGEAFYATMLERTTTTDMTAEQIHQLGLDEVARIHGEMRAIKEQVGFDGDLDAFFEYLRTDPKFYFDNTDEGRAAYLTQATDYIDQMRDRLDEVFGIKPKADLVVKAVEPFREKSAGKAFYEVPTADGSRPGTYYANLYNMANMPSYQMEALAFHEGIPGHHMQLATAIELESVPKFRRYAMYTAYIEGWGLYSEYLPKEMGFYQDPYSDFGRLAMELWRACRLVVDTGIHQKGWSREQAIQYLADNTPNPQGDIVKAIERYIVMPSQATAYKIGMIKILQMRADAKATMGEAFDLRGFHDVILANGALPLNMLEQQVQQWAQGQIAAN
ncbi:Uncharacterized conserved protein, DUF885 familyt [Ferrimonas marina]|uniref:Uncharacterized conserved protein, DUF885 familyt n=1 Tax=Ferrimonas marina TaxID=299255 RepID=A0A1M5YD99_9GAMM|nr:Uncharacterized conserved protein, DUF885 familyt [Ferrimonas marina]